MKHNKLKIVGILLGILVVLVVLGTMGVSYYVGWNLTHPERRPITKTPASYHLGFQDIHFPSRIDHLQIKGWLIPADSGTNKLVIIAHGYKDNRSNIRPVLPLADTLSRAGISVILFDFRAEGESPGKVVSVGEYEVRDLLGAVDYARAHHYMKIGVIGYSMGASTAILAAAKDTLITAVVADSPFANLHRYLSSHMPHWTNLPNFPFTPEILWEMDIFNGLNVNKVAPDKVLKTWKPRPLLLIAGTADRTIPMSNSRLLYNEVKSEPNVYLWIVNGAHHVGAYEINPRKYLDKVVSFFIRYLGTPGMKPLTSAN